MSIREVPVPYDPHRPHWRKGALYVDGTCRRVLEPGRHRLARRAQVRRVLVLDRVETTAPQDVLTADGVTVRVTVAIRWAVADAQRYVESAAEPLTFVYLAVQVALRDAPRPDRRGGGPPTRRTLGATITDAARRPASCSVSPCAARWSGRRPAPRAARGVRRAGHREGKRGQAQLEVAGRDGRAALARERRQPLDDHPGLARLRLVQALPPGSRSSWSRPEA